jgi:two-component system cell cycle response regulator DivK
MAKTVLIIEDNELNLKLLNDILQAEGYSTVCFGNGEEALDAVRRAPPDLIMMDIRLPGMSGLDATRALKADLALKGIPVVAVTAYAMDGDEKAIRDAGCDGFLAKPFSIESLLAILGRFLP